jgi:hypothetical protein
MADTKTATLASSAVESWLRDLERTAVITSMIQETAAGGRVKVTVTYEARHQAAAPPNSTPPPMPPGETPGLR